MKGGLAGLMKQAQQMQEKMNRAQEELGAAGVEEDVAAGHRLDGLDQLLVEQLVAVFGVDAVGRRPFVVGCQTGSPGLRPTNQRKNQVIAQMLDEHLLRANAVDRLQQQLLQRDPGLPPSG